MFAYLNIGLNEIERIRKNIYIRHALYTLLRKHIKNDKYKYIKIWKMFNKSRDEIKSIKENEKKRSFRHAWKIVLNKALRLVNFFLHLQEFIINYVVYKIFTKKQCY